MEVSRRREQTEEIMALVLGILKKRDGRELRGIDLMAKLALLIRFVDVELAGPEH